VAGTADREEIAVVRTTTRV